MCTVNAKRVEFEPHPALAVVCEQALFCDFGREKLATRVGGSAGKIFSSTRPSELVRRVPLAEKWCESFFVIIKKQRSLKSVLTLTREPHN